MNRTKKNWYFKWFIKPPAKKTKHTCWVFKKTARAQAGENFQIVWRFRECCLKDEHPASKRKRLTRCRSLAQPKSAMIKPIFKHRKQPPKNKAPRWPRPTGYKVKSSLLRRLVESQREHHVIKVQTWHSYHKKQKPSPIFIIRGGVLLMSLPNKGCGSHTPVIQINRLKIFVLLQQKLFLKKNLLGQPQR